MNRLLVIISLLTAMTTLPMAASSVQEMNDDAITEVIDNSPTIKPVTGGLEITVSDGKAHEFYIYSITGQLVKRVKSRLYTDSRTSARLLHRQMQFLVQENCCAMTT